MSDRPIDVVAGVEALRPEHGPLFAVIGVFDGIHVGHRFLLEHLVANARDRSARPGVITFDSHPDEVIVGAAPPLLLDPGERVRMLGEAGVEVVVVQHFDAALRATEYDAFVGFITSRTRLAGILMTPEAAFGHERRGTPYTVAELGGREGFDLVVVPPFELDGLSVRSADIRSAIASGDLATAKRLLGRPYSIAGTVAADGSLRFEMPVAQPPGGTYPVAVDGIGTSGATSLVIDDAGGMQLHGPETTPAGMVVNVVFDA